MCDDARAASEFWLDEYATEGVFEQNVKMWSGIEVNPEMVGWSCGYFETDFIYFNPLLDKERFQYGE